MSQKGWQSLDKLELVNALEPVAFMLSRFAADPSEKSAEMLQGEIEDLYATFWPDADPLDRAEDREERYRTAVAMAADYHARTVRSGFRVIPGGADTLRKAQ